MELRHSECQKVPQWGALHRTLRRGAGRVRSGVSSSLKITNTLQRALAAAKNCTPTSCCGFVHPTEAAGATSLPAEDPRQTSFERVFPERFATLIRTQHGKWKVQHRGCFAKSRSWPDQPRPLFMSSKRASNNRPWAGLVSQFGDRFRAISRINGAEDLLY